MMKDVNGYICIVLMEYPPGHEYYILFGRNMGGGMGSHQNFETNEFVPFVSVAEASHAKEEIENRKDLRELKAVKIAKVEMVIAEDKEEFFSFKSKQCLVILKKEEFITELIGRYVKGKPHIYPLKGARFTKNGFVTIDDFDYALHVAKEINRQAGLAASIATIELKRIQ